GRAHLLLAVVKALDLEQSALLRVVREVKKRHSDWPLVVAQTSLHEGYAPRTAHVLPYPFGSQQDAEAGEVAQNLRRALQHQRSLFRSLPGGEAASFVPTDFPQPGDGYEPIDYGREALLEALIAAAPAAVAVALAELPPAHGDRTPDTFNAHILGFALAAGAS